MSSDPFPTQGRILGQLTADLQARETRRISARAAASTDYDGEAGNDSSHNAVGQEHVLRAIPVSAIGVAGAIPGTRPDLIPWEPRRRRPTRRATIQDAAKAK